MSAPVVEQYQFKCDHCPRLCTTTSRHGEKEARSRARAAGWRLDQPHTQAKTWTTRCPKHYRGKAKK